METWHAIVICTLVFGVVVGNFMLARQLARIEARQANKKGAPQNPRLQDQVTQLQQQLERNALQRQALEDAQKNAPSAPHSRHTP
ncbi:MAG: hypothetical protein R3Y10_03400 [Ferrimonas sp.]